MKILTFDTSLNKTYITLSEDDNLIVEKNIESTQEKYHSAFLVPAIVEILKDNSLTMSDISVIATNIGPGSFTGIRVCNTIARVFAQQLEAKLVGVSSLEILSKINNTSKNSLILMDARKDKVYCAVYSPTGEEIVSPKSIQKEDVLNLAKDDYFVIADKSISEYLSVHDINCVDFEKSEYPLGIYLAHIAYKKVTESSEDFYWAKLKPLYIQPPSISKPKAG